jgi:hypothetical protein
VDWEVVVIDATEILVQRPKKQKKWYSGKKSDIPLNFSYLCTIQQVKY